MFDPISVPTFIILIIPGLLAYYLYFLDEHSINKHSMSYEMIHTGEGEVIKFLHITSTSFKRWKVWRVQFHDGKETFLYRCGGEWMQWSKAHLDKPVLNAVAECIENISLRNQINLIFESVHSNVV